MSQTIEMSRTSMSELTNEQLQEVNGGGFIDSLFYYAGAILHMSYKDATNPNYKQDQGSAAMHSALG